MSTVSRWISGSAASWAKILITVVSQVALVPLYLTYWDVDTFGIWVAIQALTIILTLIDFGHQTYLEFEFIKLGKENIKAIALDLWSGVLVGIFLSIIQIALIVVIIITGGLNVLLDHPDGGDVRLMRDAGFALIFQGITWMLSYSSLGLIGRALSPFGYYPRMAWWNVGCLVVTALATCVAVVMGGGLFETGLAICIATAIFTLPFYVDTYRIMKKEKLPYVVPSFSHGWRNFWKSCPISGKLVLDNVRQQGARLLISPLVGLSSMAAFSATRTGANFAMQGLNTITNPLMPELMRFLHKRDQQKSEASFGIIWIVVVAIVAPALVLLQVFIEPIFEVWTKGKIPVNQWLFGVLSLNVLIFAWSQPAIAIVRGNNLVKPQLTISIITALIVVGGIFMLVPPLGITGAGLALMVAEVFAAVCYWSVASKWMNRNSLRWPALLSSVSTIAVLITAISIVMLISLPDYRWIILVTSMLLFFWNTRNFWRLLPSFATSEARRIINNLPGWKQFNAARTSK